MDVIRHRVCRDPVTTLHRHGLTQHNNCWGTFSSSHREGSNGLHPIPAPSLAALPLYFIPLQTRGILETSMRSPRRHRGQRMRVRASARRTLSARSTGARRKENQSSNAQFFHGLPPHIHQLALIRGRATWSGARRREMCAGRSRQAFRLSYLCACARDTCMPIRTASYHLSEGGSSADTPKPYPKPQTLNPKPCNMQT